MMPIVYLGALLVAGLLYPDYSHVRQQPSELGANGAPYDFGWAFNLALVLSGFLGFCGALGVVMGLRHLQIGRLLATVTGVVPAIPSLALVLAGVFPLPSPYHGSLVLYVAGIFFPLLGWFSLRKFEGLHITKLTLMAAFLASLVVVALILGVGEVVSAENVGLWIRIWAMCSFPTIALMCFTIRNMLLPR